MTLPASGAISLSQVNVELGLSSTASINMGAANVRTLFGVASGAISMSNGYGKSNRAAVSYTISSNTANASINVASLSGYSAGTSDITITVNSGVYVYSTSTGTPGLTLTGGSTGDTITLVNNGYIMGKGGKGGAGGNGNPGGTALSLGFNTTVNNTNGSAYIGGGGGGGAGIGYGAGGGVGGGDGGGGNFGVGGGPGSSGTNAYTTSSSGPYGTHYTSGGGGGGRVFPGVGGAGGSSGGVPNGWGRGGTGGGGGSAASYQATGGAGGSSNNTGGQPSGGGGGPGIPAADSGGGGWGASGGYSPWGDKLGGGGGKAVALNGRTVTWVSGDTSRVWGAVS